jgi:hypothetical protein
MLLSDPPLIVMCDLGGRIARWMGGLNTAAEALIGQTHVASTPMSALALSGHFICSAECPLSGVKQHDFSEPPSRKRFSYFLLGRLRFGDDGASRRFAHRVSDGLPLI